MALLRPTTTVSARESERIQGQRSEKSRNRVAAVVVEAAAAVTGRTVAVVAGHDESSQRMARYRYKTSAARGRQPASLLATSVTGPPLPP